MLDGLFFSESNVFVFVTTITEPDPPAPWKKNYRLFIVVMGVQK